MRRLRTTLATLLAALLFAAPTLGQVGGGVTIPNAVTSAAVIAGLGYTPANCTAGTAASNCLQLTSNATIGLTSSTVTTSNPILDLAQTWNAGGVTFTGLKFNVTSTASAAASLLMDLQVATVSQFKVDKSGNVTLAGTLTGPTTLTVAAGSQIILANLTYFGPTAATAGGFFTTSGMGLISTAYLGFINSTNPSTGSVDVAFSRLNPSSMGLGSGAAGSVAGSLSLTGITQAAGGLFNVTSGTNQRAGNLTLIGGTKTVNNTTVTANTVVMLTRKTSGGTLGTAITYTLNAGTSFTVTSDSGLDTSTFSYWLLEVP